MPLLTFNPNPRPSPGSQVTRTLALNEAEFGDGYTQASPRGLNHQRLTITLKWEGLTPSQKDALEAFFVQHGGYRAFAYTPLGFSGALKWTCKEWGYTNSAPYAFNAKLVQNFTLEAIA